MPHRNSVLVVADELEPRARIARALQSAGHTVELAEDGNRALKLAAGGTVEAAIVAMGCGPAAAAILRELRGAVPKMIVLADAADEGPDHSLLPADVFPLRPLDEQQLLARLAELVAPPPNPDDDNRPAVLCFEGCRFDLAGRIFVDAGGREVPLTRSEAALLTIFVRNPGRVLSRDQLRRVVAGHGADAFDRSVDMLVRRLRHKIEPDPKVPRFILTVSGGGYKFAARPRNIESSEAPSAAIARTEPEPPKLDRLGHEPERRQLTLLSCGLAGATTLAADGDLEEIGDVIHNFQRACTAAIQRMGGSIARSMGEEILALFGYPQAHEDDAERAVQAALDLIGRVGEMRSGSGAPLQVQTVITTGLVLVDRGQEIIGEPPVLAARLRMTAPPNSLMITAATRRLIGRVFDLEGPMFHQPDGVSEPVMTYRVTGRRPARTRFEANRTEKLTRFVGRRKELHQLLVLWERATAGNGQVALICGEAGIGKSRMCEAFLDCIASEPHITIRYQCSAHHVNSPFHPIIGQLEQAAGFDRHDTPETRLEKLETALSQIGPASSTDMALYAALLSIPPTPGDRRLWQELTPRRRKDLTIAALVRQILALAHKQPLIIKLADAHWIDSSTLELFGRIIASITAARVFVVVSCRPEFFTHWLEHSHVSILRLNRLEREHARDIVLDVAGGKPLPDQICEQIIAKSDGIPLFVEELTKTVLESGLLQESSGPYIGGGQLSLVTIPVTLADSLMARLDKLGAAKEVAQIGAAIGREFSYRLLAAVAPMSPAALRSALAQLSSPELILVRGEPPDSTYNFKHALVQDAAYATLPSSKRRQLHARIARALEETFPETIQTQPELIAHHLAQAGLPRQAIDYLQKAGALAIEQSANAEAIGHLTRAIDLLQSLPEGPERAQSALRLQAMLGQATIAMRGYAAPETREILLRAKALINDLSDHTAKFAILYGLWAAYYVGGVSSGQKSAAEEFLAAARRHEEAASLCIAHRLLGTTCLTSGEFTAALGHLQRARALYDPQRDAGLRHQYGQDIGAAALCYLSWALWHLGSIDQATKVADAAVRRADELSHPHTLAYTICHARGFMEIFRRSADDLQSFADLVVSLCTEHGFSHWINCGRIFQGWAAICRGEISEGIEMLRAGVTAWRGTGARLWLPTFLMLEAEAYAKIGRSDAALQAVDHALAVSKDTGERWAKAEALRIKARLLFETHRAAADEIESLLVASLKTARRQRARCYELRSACALARIWQGQDRGEEALSLLRPVYDQFTEGFDTADLKEAGTLIQELVP